jgi:signal transduction histidine kinase
MSAPLPAIMVVDDEPDILRSVHDLLRRTYRVLTFERPQAALEALQEQDVPVVMSDQRMPEMSGVEFLSHVKRLRPETTRLLCTGYTDIHAMVGAINEGSVFRYITKPWDEDFLHTVLAQAVEQHDLLVDRRNLIEELKHRNVQLQEANRLKRNFIEVASHELNTPVAVVLGMTELCRISFDQNATAAQRSWLERVHAAGQRLAATVERMLQLLRSGEFDRTLALKTVELEPLIVKAVNELRPFLEARRQTVQIAVEPNLGSAQVDPLKIGDVLTNLIVNAIKFTPDEGKIKVCAAAVGHDFVRVEVSDSGPGIEPEAQGHLFEPFFTGYDTMRHSSGEFQYGKRGIGLGLCLVKSFVQLHGGQVEVQSDPAAGSTFGFTLPRMNRRAGLMLATG